MPIRHTLCLLAVTLLTGCLSSPETQSPSAPDRISVDRPNILWITAEDMSPTLGCYGDAYAVTPHLDRFAQQSVRYTHAFATAPVCSPSRACLINGLTAPVQGTQQMRSAFPIPDRMQGFPSLLRRAGYHTTNNVKTDYNSANAPAIIEASWDESSADAHWRQRPADKPFFSVFNLMTSHQSRTMVWPYEKFQAEVQSRLKADRIHDPARAPLPPYYVDTPVVRKTVARFYDCVTAMDAEVGAILKQLEDDGLADDTIVFFYSDHGSGMPRHKRALLDSGMRVPLMIRVPEKYRHLAPAQAGSTSDRLVSFDDFGPTVLSLLNLPIPDYMEGRPFLGPKQTEPRRHTFGHRDRVDEVIDLARSARDKRYLYIRNYMPHLGYNQPTAWPDLGEIRHEFYRLADRRRMNAAQWHFAGPTRPVEELYDCQADPQNLKNLVGSAEHAAILKRMRGVLHEHLVESKDLGFMPEALAWTWSEGTTPYAKARTPGAEQRLKELIHAASLVGVGLERDFLQELKDEDPAVRYWGAVGCSAAGRLSDDAVQTLQEALEDPVATVRIEAANALARHGRTDRAVPVLAAALEEKNLAAVLHAARTIELLGDKARGAVPAMRRADARMKRLRPADTPATVVQSGDQDMAMFIGFSIDAFLARVDSEVSAESDGWIPLFDGKTLDGWTASAPNQSVQAVDGEIRILSKKANLWLLHDTAYENFELEVEARMPADAYNSGVGFRCTAGAKKPKGYQCEIDRQKTGQIYAIGKGWVWPKNASEKARFAQMAGDCFQDDGWNKIKIRCDGKQIRIWVNGTLTADLEDGLFDAGVVALQHHGKGGVHRFRNVRIRPLP